MLATAAKLVRMPISRRAFSLGALGAPALLRAARPVPKLLVLLALEEFRSDYLERNRAAFGKNGFRRLVEEGCYFPDCRMSASSFTSSGLATLATGAWPQSHGIVADHWYDPATRRIVRARPEALEATSVADQIAQDPKSRIFAIGLEEAHAALLAGRNPAALFAMDARGEFGVRGSAAVSWFGAFQRANPPANLRDAAWMALGARTDSHPLRLLTYDPARPQDFVFLYQSSPFGQSTQFELAREVIVRERLGQGGGLDCLAVAAGSTALLGYDVGADSPLIDQLVLHLDREIERLLDTLNDSVGPGNYALVFTAAHGGPAQPPVTSPRAAVPGEALARSIEKALAERFKPVGVDRYVYPFLYLRIPPGLAADRRQIRAAAAQAALQVTGVTGYFTADGDCSHGGDWQQRFRNSFHVLRSGDVMLSYAPGWVEDFGAGRGISYGSLYNYDCRVPLIFYGWQSQFRPRTYEQPVEAIDIAPTLARIAGRAYPSSTTGRVLAEAFE
jgi:Type I phosphodiesterase / nucleotide pyrophosphatase